MLYLNTLKHLLYADLKIFTENFKDKCADLLIWIISMVLVTYYIMPTFGLSHGYTPFLIASLCASAGLFEMWTSTVAWVSDLTGEQIISYYLTLPIPSWLIFVRSMIVNAINSAILGVLVLPICKILLWNHVNFTSLHLPKFIFFLLLLNTFYGAFSLLLASSVSSMQTIGSLWMRFIYPLWFFGCFQFSWSALYAISPALAYINLLNPMTYVMEGVRNAILGPQGSLPFWICATMLILATALFAIVGIRRMKKQLDFV